MESEAQAKILQLLDVISVEVAASRTDTSELRGKMLAGFGRGVETELRSFRSVSAARFRRS
jgi:hypothetical protein